MSLAKLELFNVRNIAHGLLHPSPRLNLIIGENGSGKTALLEAICILGRGRSFRTAHVDHVISHGAEHLVVSGQVATGGHLLQLGVRLDGKQAQLRIAGQDVRSRSELVFALPLQLLLPNSQVLLEGGPQLRREFVDWGAFHVETNFLPVWRHYRRALSQRNALLKSTQSRDMDVWEHELAQYGTMINGFRSRYVERLASAFSNIAPRFLPFRRYELKYVEGWDAAKPLLDVLKNDRPRDRRYGFTQSGPHRGDWRLLVDGKPAREHASRGQTKLLVIALKLAQVGVLREVTGAAACVLIDDLAAEIDEKNRSKVLGYFADLESQLFVTATDADVFGTISCQDDRSFRVERGQIKHV